MANQNLISNPNPLVPDSSDFWEHEFHKDWRHYGQSKVAAINPHESFPANADDLALYNCHVQAGSVISSDTSFWIRGVSDPRITSFVELNTAVRKNTMIDVQTPNDTLPAAMVKPADAQYSMSFLPGNVCETCIESSFQLIDIDSTGGSLKFFSASHGDRFTIVNTTPPDSGYSSSFFTMVNGILTKVHYNHNLSSTESLSDSCKFDNFPNETFPRTQVLIYSQSIGASFTETYNEGRYFTYVTESEGAVFDFPYYHTSSSGTNTWMPAGTYSYAEAFAMAINEYSPWFTASADTFTSNSVTVTTTMCDNAYINNIHTPIFANLSADQTASVGCYCCPGRTFSIHTHSIIPAIGWTTNSFNETGRYYDWNHYQYGGFYHGVEITPESSASNGYSTFGKLGLTQSLEEKKCFCNSQLPEEYGRNLQNQYGIKDPYWYNNYSSIFANSLIDYEKNSIGAWGTNFHSYLTIDDNVNHKVKYPTCYCTNLEAWNNFAYQKLGSTATYYKLTFSDGYTFKAGPYLRLLTYNPLHLSATQSLTNAPNSGNWPAEINSRTIEELYTSQSLHQNIILSPDLAVIKCNDIIPGVTKTSGFLYITGIEVLADANMYSSDVNKYEFNPSNNDFHFNLNGTSSMCHNNEYEICTPSTGATNGFGYDPLFGTGVNCTYSFSHSTATYSAGDSVPFSAGATYSGGEPVGFATFSFIGSTGLSNNFPTYAQAMFYATSSYVGFTTVNMNPATNTVGQYIFKTGSSLSESVNILRHSMSAVFAGYYNFSASTSYSWHQTSIGCGDVTNVIAMSSSGGSSSCNYLPFISMSGGNDGESGNDQLHSYWVRPKTTFPQAFYTESIYEGVLMLENGLYALFEGNCNVTEVEGCMEGCADNFDARATVQGDSECCTTIPDNSFRTYLQTAPSAAVFGHTSSEKGRPFNDLINGTLNYFGWNTTFGYPLWFGGLFTNTTNTHVHWTSSADGVTIHTYQTSSKIGFNVDFYASTLYGTSYAPLNHYFTGVPSNNWEENLKMFGGSMWSKGALYTGSNYEGGKSPNNMTGSVSVSCANYGTLGAPNYHIVNEASVSRIVHIHGHGTESMSIGGRNINDDQTVFDTTYYRGQPMDTSSVRNTMDIAGIECMTDLSIFSWHHANLPQAAFTRSRALKRLYLTNLYDFHYLDISKNQELDAVAIANTRLRQDLTFNNHCNLQYLELSCSFQEEGTSNYHKLNLGGCQHLHKLQIAEMAIDIPDLNNLPELDLLYMNRMSGSRTHRNRFPDISCNKMLYTMSACNSGWYKAPILESNQELQYCMLVSSSFNTFRLPSGSKMKILDISHCQIQDAANVDVTEASELVSLRIAANNYVSEFANMEFNSYTHSLQSTNFMQPFVGFSGSVHGAQYCMMNSGSGMSGSLDLTGNPKLYNFEGQNNQLSQSDMFVTNTFLRFLNINNNEFAGTGSGTATLDITNLKYLKELYISNGDQTLGGGSVRNPNSAQVTMLNGTEPKIPYLNINSYQSYRLTQRPGTTNNGEYYKDNLGNKGYDNYHEGCYYYRGGGRNASADSYKSHYSWSSMGNDFTRSGIDLSGNPNLAKFIAHDCNLGGTKGDLGRTGHGTVDFSYQSGSLSCIDIENNGFTGSIGGNHYNDIYIPTHSIAGAPGYCYDTGFMLNPFIQATGKLNQNGFKVQPTYSHYDINADTIECYFGNKYSHQHWQPRAQLANYGNGASGPRHTVHGRNNNWSTMSFNFLPSQSHAKLYFANLFNLEWIDMRNLHFTQSQVSGGVGSVYGAQIYQKLYPYGSGAGDALPVGENGQGSLKVCLASEESASAASSSLVDWNANPYYAVQFLPIDTIFTWSSSPGDEWINDPFHSGSGTGGFYKGIRL